MKTLLLLLACVVLGDMQSPNRPTTIFGRLSGIDGDIYHELDVRVAFFGHSTGGECVAVQHYFAIAVVHGYFALPSATQHLTPPLYVELAIRPAGRRYAAFQPAGPRRQLQFDQGMHVWKLAGTTADSTSVLSRTQAPQSRQPSIGRNL